MHWHVIKQSWVRKLPHTGQSEAATRLELDAGHGRKIILLVGHCKVHSHTHPDAPHGHTHYGDLGSVRTMKQAEARTIEYTASVERAREKRVQR